jgi:hypothetical protein
MRSKTRRSSLRRGKGKPDIGQFLAGIVTHGARFIEHFVDGRDDGFLVMGVLDDFARAG